jgi:hypothetical protein
VRCGRESIQVIVRVRVPGAILGVWAAGMLLSCVCAIARAQQTGFLPEVDVDYSLSSNARIRVQAKDDREGGDPQQATIGPSLLLYRRPLMKLKHVLIFDVDNTKSRLFVLETGYRVITAPGKPETNRMIEAVTFHYPLVHQFLITNRVRFDLDWQNGAFTWRFRDKATVERTLRIYSYHFAPFVAAEPFYESQYGKWSSTDLYAGADFPLGKRAEIDPYYEHENDTGKSPNTQRNYAGVQLQIFLGSKE